MPREHASDAHDDLPTRSGRARSITLAAAVALVAIGLVIGTMLGHWLASSQLEAAVDEAAVAREDLERLARAHETLQEWHWILYLESREATPAEPTDGAPPTPGEFTDGTYRVGTDIEPGTYRGEVNGEFGYWARLRNTSGVISGIVANNIVRGPFVLTIVPTDAAVELRGVTLTAEE
jgi:hypothetical protein